MQTASVVEVAATRARTAPRVYAFVPGSRPAARQGDIILCIVPKGSVTPGARIEGADVQLAQGNTRGSRHIARVPAGWSAHRYDAPYKTGNGGTLLANVLIATPPEGGTITVDHPEHPAHTATVPAGYDLLACSQVDHASEALQRVRD